MNEITTLLKSPTFWFAAIFIAAFVNIATHYAIKPIDRALSALFTRWKNRSEQSRKKHDQLIQELVEEDDEFLFAMINYACSAIIGALSSLLGASFFLIGLSIKSQPDLYSLKGTCSLIASILLAIGFMFLTRGTSQKEQILKAMEQRKDTKNQVSALKQKDSKT